MKKNRIIFIGSQYVGHLPDDGETMKNKLMRDAIQPYVDKITPIDLRKRLKRYWYLIKLLFLLIFSRNSKIIVSASVYVAYSILKVIYLLGWRHNVYYWVVGGLFDKIIKEGKLQRKYYQHIDKIIVQSKSMEINLFSVGLTQVITVPNSKKIDYLPKYSDKKKSANKFVFVSRITPDKGVEYIITVADRLCKSGITKFTIDFYGRLDNDYSDKFLDLINATKNVSYKGLLDLTNPKGYDILAKYDMMLFPTFYPGEGFAGILIDAFIAGLPVIASDWRENSKIIIHEYNGIIVPVHDIDALESGIIDSMDGKYDLLKLSNNARSECMKYDTSMILTKDLLHKIGIVG